MLPSGSELEEACPQKCARSLRCRDLLHFPLVFLGLDIPGELFQRLCLHLLVIVQIDVQKPVLLVLLEVDVASHRLECPDHSPLLQDLMHLVRHPLHLSLLLDVAEHLHDRLHHDSALSDRLDQFCSSDSAQCLTGSLHPYLESLPNDSLVLALLNSSQPLSIPSILRDGSAPYSNDLLDDSLLMELQSYVLLFPVYLPRDCPFFPVIDGFASLSQCPFLLCLLPSLFPGLALLYSGLPSVPEKCLSAESPLIEP